MIFAAGYPHEAPSTGAAAEFADRLQGLLPVIATDRLTLRAPNIADFAAYAEIMMSERAVHMDGPMEREEAWFDFTSTVSSWLLRGFGLWTVTLNSNGETLGFVLLNMEPGDREPELGFFFRAASEGKGYALEAAEAARDHALDVLGLDRLVSYVAIENARSADLAERMGAVRDGVAEAQMLEDIHVWRHAPLDDGSADDADEEENSADSNDSEGGMEAYA
ncbi:GNAT family N-acetyltransferase [uncultured Maritimibacter sp.]|jgi:RimJ/RimL family protein N-acetyltransferase|uniref:GNAT family N-acetyltransferase n=1 Tax=uncultured Maritimibacter sp. TaxID=991866 RepID=UPI000B095FA9|nr:GNAT family N-acetyltransferase [uncultured Maritimibacter sp.]